jgi:hypothetical protein
VKTYAVRIEGTGINFPAEEGAAPAIGFFTTRRVKASSLTDAPDLALQLILSEWASSGEYGPGNSGQPPHLVVEETWKIGALRALLGRKPGGYSFYASV